MNAADFRAEAIEDRGALGSTFVLRKSGRTCAAGIVAAGPSCDLERACGAGGGECLGHWRGRSAKRFSSIARARDARRIAAFFEWSGADQRQLQLEPGGAARHDLGAGGDSELSAGGFWPPGRCANWARLRLQLHREAGVFAAETGKVDWVIGVEGDAAQIVEGAVSAGVPRAQTKFFRLVGRSSKVSGASSSRLAICLLVKGSRGVKMERIVEALLTRYAAPGEIPRQKVRH